MSLVSRAPRWGAHSHDRAMSAWPDNGAGADIARGRDDRSPISPETAAVARLLRRSKSATLPHPINGASRGERLPAPGSGSGPNQVETLCPYLSRIAARRMRLPLKRDVPKSPFGTTSSSTRPSAGIHTKETVPFWFRTTICMRAAFCGGSLRTSGEKR